MNLLLIRAAIVFLHPLINENFAIFNPMKTAFLITNRNITASGPGNSLVKSLCFFTAPVTAMLDQWSSWSKVTGTEFRDLLMAETAAFPMLAPEDNEQERHLSLFVHGYNNSWGDTARRYQQLIQALYSGQNPLGVLLLVSWPSNGRVTDYLPDREDARDGAATLAELFVKLHDHVRAMQLLAAKTNNPANLCRAKISVIAHSMGNFVMQKALAVTSKRLNNPGLITLIHQMVMVAADVDNDLFQRDKPADSDGQLMANLCYRITAAYSGLDSVLGASAGLKHSGTRRLGRSGLADRDKVLDNVWDQDVSGLIKGAPSSHSGLFDTQAGLGFLEQVLRGVDRRHIRL